MKTFKIILLSGFLWLLNSCGDPLEDFKIHISPDYYSYSINIYAMDMAEPNLPLEGVSLSITGPDAAAVFNFDGTKNFDFSTGAIMLILDPALSPSEGNPVIFNVTISKPGYQSKTERFEIGMPQEITERIVYIYSKNNSTPGISIANSQGTLSSDGALNAAVDVSMGSIDGNETGIELSIPAGTKFYDDSGVQISGGNFEVEVVQFGSGSDARFFLNSETPGVLPLEKNGQLNATLDEDHELVEINMTVGTSTVASFSEGQPLLRIGVEPGQYNFDQERALAAGDSIGLISLTDGDENWMDDGKGIIFEENGNLYAEFALSHLSKFTLSNASETVRFEFFAAFDDGNSFVVSRSDVKVSYTLNGSQKIFNPKIASASRCRYRGSGAFNKSYPHFYVPGPASLGSSIAPGALGTFEVEINHSTGTLTNWTVEETNNTFPGFSRTLITSPVPVLLKATYTITCQNDPSPKQVLYPPKGYKLYLLDPADFNPFEFKPNPFMDAPTYIIPESSHRNFEAYSVNDGQQYMLAVYDPAFPFFPVFNQLITVNDGEDHDIRLDDEKCTALKDRQPSN